MFIKYEYFNSDGEGDDIVTTALTPEVEEDPCTPVKENFRLYFPTKAHQCN